MLTARYSNDAYQYVENLISSQSEIAIIPRELVTNEMRCIVNETCIIRAGIVSVFAFNNAAASILSTAGQPEFCAAYFVNSLVGSALTYKLGNRLAAQAGDLVKRRQVFDNASPNALLNSWIMQNNIGLFAFSKTNQLMLLSERKSSELEIVESVYMQYIHSTYP